MLKDANLILRTSVTITATTPGPTMDAGGTPKSRHAMNAEIDYSAASQASGSGVWTFVVQHSDDNATWFDLASGADQAITLTGSAQAGNINIPNITTDKRYLRVNPVLSGSPVTPTITYKAYLGLAKP